jgi:predicted nucleic acid-binding protein
MEIRLNIPDDIAARLGQNIERRMLEHFALDEYRASRLTHAQLPEARRRRAGILAGRSAPGQRHNRKTHQLMLIVSDTGPLNYLVLIRHEHILPTLFHSVVIPLKVFEELQRDATPPAVRQWIAQAPDWLSTRAVSRPLDLVTDALGEGEREAILLAEELGAAALLIDDKAGRDEAARRHIPFTGTLGVLRAAALKDLIDLPGAIRRLRETSFREPAQIVAAMLEEDANRNKKS